MSALACADAAPQMTSTTRSAADPPVAGSSLTPRETHVVFSPLVGSGGTPAAPLAAPAVEIFANTTALKVGEELMITALPGNAETPFYYLFIRDSSAAEAAHSVGVSSMNEVFPGTNTSHILELVSATGEHGRAVFILRALGEGLTEVWVSVVGPASGASTLGGVSASIWINVQR